MSDKRPAPSSRYDCDCRGLPSDDDEWDTFPVRLRRQANTIAELQGVVNSWRRAHEIVELERDEWKARAEAAEQYAQAVSDSNRDNADRASKAERERDEWKARADKWHGEWQKITPARTVSREDVDEAVRGTLDGWNITLPSNLFDAQIDAVCALFGVEAEPADPVEELAGQIEAATRTAIRQVCDDLAAVVPTLDPLTVERAMEVTAASRKVAAHVLGQEASDE